jgi:outer membrane protein OmpA-like peptidoglycan-associated protein
MLFWFKYYALMKNIYKLTYTILFFLLSITTIQAQHWLGYANSSYAGTNGMYLNPATMANNKYNFYMNLAGANVNFYNDYMKLNTPYSLWSLAFNNVPPQYQDASGNAVFENSYLAENLNGKNKDVSLMTEVRGPSLLFSLGHRHTIAIGTRVRAAVQVLDMNENLARIIRWGTDPTDPAFSGPDSLSYNTLYGQNDFTLNANAFAEFSFSYGGMVYEKKANALKVGFTVKRLTGLYSSYFQNKPDGGLIVYDNDSLGFVNTSLQYAYVNENYYTDNSNSFNLSRILFDDPLGKGWGFDIGFAYEYRPEYENFRYTMDGKKNRYDRSSVRHKFRIAAAVTDIGGINYNNSKWVGERVLPQNLSRDLGQVDTLKRMFDDFGQESENLNGFDRMNDYIGRISGGFQSANNSFRTALPTTLNLQFDYNVYKNFFANITYIQSLRRKGTVSMRHFTQLSVTPRYESQWFEAAVPFVVNNDFKSVNFGIFLKLGPLFFGSDRVGSLLFNTRNLFAMDVYAGLAIPIAHRKPRDRDEDMVSNKKDKCPDVAGVWKFKGCPDTDGDGIADKDDRCPEVAGIKSMKGCPDTDEDGITDSLDNCPELAGIEKFNGCPDTDEDNVPDSEDECPEIAGVYELKGCPDSDGDNIPDNKDDCPNEKGLEQYNGCPEPVVDKPEEPVEEPEAQGEDKVLQEAYDNLQFETGSSVIKKESYDALNNLARLLTVKKSYLVSIDGHTDNVGSSANNRVLSKQRAQAVKKYLTDKSIDGSRIFTEGYGDTKPIASNATAAGRKKNRRVEFLIMRVAE